MIEIIKEMNKVIILDYDNTLEDGSPLITEMTIEEFDNSCFKDLE